MNLLKQKVEHRTFGTGTIFAVKGNRIYVTFRKPYGDKVLPYPEVFRQNMSLVNGELQDNLLAELTK